MEVREEFEYRNGEAKEFNLVVLEDRRDFINYEQNK